MNKLYRILLAASIVLMLGLLSSCQSQTPVPTALPSPTLPPTPEPTLQPTPNTDEIHAAIVNALMALYVQANRMEVTTVTGDGEPQTNVIEFVPPDRKRLVDEKEGVEYIVAGGIVYALTTSSGQWEETQIPASTFMSDAGITAEQIGSTISDPQWLRKDTLDGHAVNVYSYNSTTSSGDIELHSQTELWVGEADGLPYQMIIDGEILGASTDPGTGETELKAVKALTTTQIDFDPAIQIEPPTP
ncbi:MAG: hypothetical protein EHM70_22605 [Chloroflexota bacterium]|nr:MAG: hypothetical protein EHM70_22605 [Chloroflexota bacterium]